MLDRICLQNHAVASRRPEWLQSRFYGGVSKPADLVDHSGCEFCQTITDYFVTKHALHPDNNKSSRQAEAGTQYAFTLTMPTGWNSMKPLEEVARSIMEYGITNKPYEHASKWAYVLEHTANGTPHIHGVYETPSGRRIASKYFQRYHNMREFKPTEKDKHFWNENVNLGNGFRGGYHLKVRHGQSYEGYLEKEGVVIKGGPLPE